MVRQVRSGDLLGRGPAVTSGTPATSPRARRPPTASCRASAPTARSAAASGSTSRTRRSSRSRATPTPRSPRPAVPQGVGQRAAGQLPRPPDRRCSTARRTRTEWERLDLDTADRHGRRPVPRGAPPRLAGTRRPRAALLRRTMGIAALGGATLDNEENYLIKKLFTAAGAIQIENQARI